VFDSQEMSGSKVRNFAAALGGDEDAVVLDVWMARAMGLESQKLFSNDKAYALFSDAVREMASEASAETGRPVKPRQYQAAVWTGVKETWEGAKRGASFMQLLPEQMHKLPQQALVSPQEPEEFKLTSGWVRKNCRMS
jgi:hypothetical protein